MLGTVVGVVLWAMAAPAGASAVAAVMAVRAGRMVRRMVGSWARRGGGGMAPLRAAAGRAGPRLGGDVAHLGPRGQEARGDGVRIPVLRRRSAVGRLPAHG